MIEAKMRQTPRERAKSHVEDRTGKMLALGCDVGTEPYPPWTTQDLKAVRTLLKPDEGPVKREARKYRKALEALTRAVLRHLALLDEVMKGPSTVERGRTIGRLATALDMANDQARYFALGVDFRKDNKAKASRKACEPSLST